MTGTDQLARHRRDFGTWGEDLAARHLQDRGLVLLARNWRCREGELDLVLTDRARVVFCEVKTRSGTEFGLPSETVTEVKAGRVRRAAQRWLREFRIGWCPVRYDVVTILAEAGARPRLQHIEAAF